jgi:hypothetical protein
MSWAIGRDFATASPAGCSAARCIRLRQCCTDVPRAAIRTGTRNGSKRAAGSNAEKGFILHDDRKPIRALVSCPDRYATLRGRLLREVMARGGWTDRLRTFTS